MHVKLSDIADIRTGYSFRGKVEHDPAGKLAVIQMRDIRDVGYVDTTRCMYVKEGPAHRRHLLESGDVVMQARGSRFPAGVVEAPFHGIAAFGLHVLHPVDKVLPSYLAWVLNQPTIRSTLDTMTQGTRIPFLSKSNLADLQFPLPALETQQHIVEVARLQQQAARLTTDLQTLHDQYAAAVTWRAATRS